MTGCKFKEGDLIIDPNMQIKTAIFKITKIHISRKDMMIDAEAINLKYESEYKWTFSNSAIHRARLATENEIASAIAERIQNG